MINCKNCGAPLSLETAVCPHCGTPNPEAQEHLKKLAQLDKDFRKTKREVTAEVKKSRKGYGVLVVLIMLLLANLFFIVLHSASYSIADDIIRSRMSESEIDRTINELLDAGEYLELDIYMEKFSLPYQKYGDYFKISYLADYYGRIVEYMTDYLYVEDTYSDPLMQVCENIKEFSDEYARTMKWEPEPFVVRHLERIYDEYEHFLKTYLKLTDEDIAAIEDMSSSQLLILANERMNNEEE